MHCQCCGLGYNTASYGKEATHVMRALCTTRWGIALNTQSG